MKSVAGLGALLKHAWHSFLHFVDNISVRLKLFIYAAVLIILMLLLAFFALFQLNEISSRHIPARAAVRNMEAALLTMHTYELTFADEADSLNAELYIKQKSGSVDAWQEKYREFETNYQILTNLTQNHTTTQDLAGIQPLIVQYRDTFLALVNAYRERGFQAFGREGVLRQRADALQINLANKPALGVFLKAQASQDRFLLYHETSAVSAFHAAAKELRTGLTTAQDRILLDEYVRMFEDVVAIYQKIGLTSNDGLRSQLNRLTSEIIPQIQAIEAQVLQSTSDSILFIERLFYAIAVAVVLIAIILALLLSRLITRKIVLLSQASSSIAKGNLAYRLPVTTTDELGQLSKSFNIMAEQLQKNRQALRERARSLSRSVRQFELVSRVVNEAIYEWDIKTGKLTWGDGIVSVFGYKPSIKNSAIEWWTERIHSEDADAINDSLNDRIRRHSASWKKEYRFRKASGEYVYCQDRGLIEYQNGEATRMIGSLVDISRQKALDRAKDEFISIASHQLRTPLGSIRWNLELLLEKAASLPKQSLEYAHDAYTSTLRMAGLVNDLLSVARIEQDRVKNIPEKTNLVIVIKAAVGEMQPIAKRRHVQIKVTGLKDTQTLVMLDPKRFREVIQNLLSNAVKYTPSKGRVAVIIESRVKDFVISIADNGIGIPLEDQSKLFTKFYRATNVTTTDTEGSGLGLFVVRSYVEAWGGRVWFTSKPHIGTTFYISIPKKPRELKERA